MLAGAEVCKPFDWRGRDGYCFSRPLGFDCVRSKESIEFLAGIRDRHGSRCLFVRDSVAAAVLGLSEKPDFSNGTPPESTIPQYVHYLYNVTHSFIVFLAVFFLIWLLLKRPLWELAAWGLHVLVDVPTHSYKFFPTPILWPLFDWKFNGWQWTTPTILIPNFVLLSLLYAWYLSQPYRTKRRRASRKLASGHN